MGRAKCNVFSIGIINLSNINDCDNANAIVNGTILNVSANTTVTGAGTYNAGLYRVLDVGQGTSSNVRIKVKKITGNAVVTPDTSNHNVYSIVATNDFIAEEAAIFQDKLILLIHQLVLNSFLMLLNQLRQV